MRASLASSTPPAIRRPAQPAVCSTPSYHLATTIASVSRTGYARRSPASCSAHFSSNAEPAEASKREYPHKRGIPLWSMGENPQKPPFITVLRHGALIGVDFAVDLRAQAGQRFGQRAKGG